MIDLKLPWASSIGDNKRFAVITAILMLIVLVVGVIVQSTKLPEQSREELEKLPPQLAKVILKKKEEPPPPPPKVEEKKPEPKPEEPKPEPKPKPEEPKPEPKPKPKEATPEQVQKAREKVKNEGVLAMKDDLAALRDSFSAMRPTGGALSKGGSEAATINRKTIIGGATSTSGGIKTAAVPSATGVSGLQGRDVTQVDSVALGDTQVAVDQKTEQALASVSKDGQRSENRIRAVLDSSKGALFNIYNRALRANPSLQGRVTFELVIEPDGQVSSVKILSSELNDRALENRLIMRMKMINFGAEKVARLKTQYVIHFLPN